MSDMGKLQWARRAASPAIYELTKAKGISGRGADVSIGARYISMSFTLRNPLQLADCLKLADPLALRCRTPVVMASRESGVVCFQFQLKETEWEPVILSDLKRGPEVVGMGLSDRRRQVNFEFARPHAGIFGATGAGKSVAVQTLIIGLALGYTPAQLNLIIIDPDADHERFRNLTHLGGIPIARDDAQIDRAMAYAHSELIQRSNANERAGRRLVVVVDEAERVLTGKRLAQAVAIAKGGRKFNVNLVLATQDPSEATLPDLIGQIGNRWVGAVDSAHTSAHLTGQAGLNCHKLTGRGDFMHVYGQFAERLLVALPRSIDFEALPRAELAPPEFEPEDVIDAVPEPDRGRGRPADPLSYEFIGRMLCHLGRAAGISNGTLAHKLRSGENKVSRHREAAGQILAGLRAEYAAVSKSLNP